MSEWLAFAALGALMFAAGLRGREPSVPGAMCAVSGGLILYLCAAVAWDHFR